MRSEIGFRVKGYGKPIRGSEGQVMPAGSDDVILQNNCVISLTCSTVFTLQTSFKALNVDKCVLVLS